MKWFKIIMISIGVMFSYNHLKAQVIDSSIVYPIPFKDTLNVYFELNQSDTVSITLMDRWATNMSFLASDSLFDTGSYDLNFVLDTLSNGTYFLKFEVGSGEERIYKLLKADTLLSAKNIEIWPQQNLLYPNPTSGILFTRNQNVEEIEVYDLSGRLLKGINGVRSTIDCADLPNGMYLFKIKTKNGDYQYQIMEKVTH